MRHISNILEFFLKLRPGLLFLCFLYFISLSPSTNGQTLSVEQQFQKLSLRQKVGQLLIFGFPGTEAEESLQKLIREKQPGAIITFGRNITSLEQIQRLNKSAQAWSLATTGIPLFIMVDQEGGNVARLKVNSLLPSALSLGETRDPSLIEDYGEAMGQLMSKVGFNMNLAPVLDLSDPLSVSFIGPRSFGGTPSEVGQMATAFARGLAMGGIIPTAKHFPGHGGVSQDSHRITPQKLQTLSELKEGDLVPFRKFANADFPRAVMMAHISYPQIDTSGVPSAFSQFFIEKVLRGDFGYRGLIMTDDLEMSGAAAAGSVEERVVRAIAAGNDMVMVAWSANRQQRALQALLQAAKSGRLPMARIDQSVRRILNHKQQIGEIHRHLAQKIGQLSLASFRSNLDGFAERVKRYNFLKTATLQPKLRGSLSNRRPVTLFASDPVFFKSFRARYGQDAHFVRLHPVSHQLLEQQLQSDQNSMFVYYASGLQTARWLNQLTSESKNRLIVVNTNQPGAIDNRKNFLGLFQLNTLAPESGRWLAEYLTDSTPDIKPFRIGVVPRSFSSERDSQ